MPKAKPTKTVSSDRVSVSYVEPHTLKPYEKNPRQITDQELEEITRSIEKFNFIEPMIVRQSDMLIVHGHQRLQAARILKLKKVPVIFIECSDTEVKILNVALNKLGGQFDNEVLLEVLREIEFEGGDVELTGFDEQEIALIESELQGPGDGLTDPDAIPEAPKKAITKRGDIWVLGDHRLLCGDSGADKDVIQLMGGRKANLLLTSPPYHVGKEYEKDQSWDDFILLLNKFVEVGTSVMLDDCFAFINFGETYSHSKLTWTLIWESFTNMGYRFFDFRAWKRPASFPIYVTTQPRSCGEIEFLHTYTKGAPNMKMRDLNISAKGLWETGSPQKPEHPASFSVDLPKKAITIYTDRNDLIYEPFLGSGSTLIACEQLNRRCYGVEIDPVYCDVTVKRWENFTGNKAKRST